MEDKQRSLPSSTVSEKQSKKLKTTLIRISPGMFRDNMGKIYEAKSSCNNCYGRGTISNVSTGTIILCGCVRLHLKSDQK